MLEALFRYAFLQHALAAGLLAALTAGIVGPILVQKRLLSMSGGVAHASFGGIGLGYYLGFEPIWGGLLFAVGAALLLSWVRIRRQQHPEPVIHVLWSAGMAFGTLLIARTPGYPPDLTSYLFGDILAVGRADLLLILLLTAFVLVAILPFFPFWHLILFDEEYAKVLRMPAGRFDAVLSLLVAVSVVVLVRVVGVVLAIAMLSIPPLVAGRLARSLRGIMIVSGLLGAGFVGSGLTVSYYTGVPSGAAIVLLGGLVYLVSGLVPEGSARKGGPGRAP